MPLRNIKDYVDVQEEITWVEFELDGQQYHWNLKVEDDWVDTDTFGMFIKLLEKRCSNKKYTYFDLGGQDLMIGCCMPEQLEKLRKTTGLDFVWLS